MTADGYRKAMDDEKRRHRDTIHKIMTDYAIQGNTWGKGDRFELKGKQFVITDESISIGIYGDLPMLSFTCRELRKDGKPYTTSRRSHYLNPDKMKGAKRI